MVKLFFDSGAAAAETIGQSPPLLTWQDPSAAASAVPDPAALQDTWAGVRGLEDQQRRFLQKLQTKGVFWKGAAPAGGMGFRLAHGGEVESDGNCLFTAVARAVGSGEGPKDLRRRAVRRFVEEYGSAREEERKAVDEIVRHLYSPDLKAGWGIHVVQDVKFLAKKADRDALDSAIQELVDLGLQRETAAESIYKERCIGVDDGLSWAKYMSVSGSVDDEFDVITMQYTEEGLLTIDDNRGGHAAAFGDDIAIESLATEFKREIYVVQAHGSDAMVDEDNCVFFLPHRPRSEICGSPFFLFMKGTDFTLHLDVNVTALSNLCLDGATSLGLPKSMLKRSDFCFMLAVVYLPSTTLQFYVDMG